MVLRVAIIASVIALFIIIYALIDCLRTRPQDARSISKPAWVLSILLLPLVGALLWFFLGRPRNSPAPEGYSAPGSSSRSSAPDDDEAFLRRLAQERAQKAREAELKRREDELKRRGGPAGGAGQAKGEGPEGDGTEGDGTEGTASGGDADGSDGDRPGRGGNPA
ncbi:PLDc N-terminal domain-containing protein [Zhihengliuella sp.]|uniref:PLDc N-terminal domain-containing protein n=1 Tax=Zhihengliuella sp. TaxID=1954483 RepID=UPI002811EAAC|nr:PLDc N-terminal domain-containing protein [Zhihengliuella sp.]